MPRISSAGATVASAWSVIGRLLRVRPETRAGRPLPAGPLEIALGVCHLGPTPQPVAGQVVSVPAFLAAGASASFVLVAAVMSDALSWKSATPIPSLVASKVVLPALAVPPAIPLIASATA